MRVSVVGLGKLGSPLAAVLASRGHQVIGVDVRPESVTDLREGRAPVREPQLQELIASSRDRLSATTDYIEAMLGSQITIVIVPTPSDERGAFSNEYVLGLDPRDRPRASQEERIPRGEHHQHSHAWLDGWEIATRWNAIRGAASVRTSGSATTPNSWPS